MGSDELSEIGVLNGGELAAWALAEAGVEVVFALHGGHLDSFLTGCRRFGIDLVDCRHEAAAVNAADGYARSTGRLGVAAVTAGPGLFNAVAGISNAAADSIGVMVVTSSPPLGEAETGEMQGCLDQIKATTDRGKGAFEAIVMVDDGCIALLRDNAEFRSYINTRLTYAMHRDEARQWRKDQQSVVGAYMVIWVLTAGFVGLLWMRQRKVKGELARLRADLDRATKDDGP